MTKLWFANRQIIELFIPKSKQLYPENLRIVEFYDQENNELLVFITNNFEVSAIEVTSLYKNRWQIEVFFKWINKILPLKNFLGTFRKCCKDTSMGHVVHIINLAYIKHITNSPLSIYEILQV